MRMFYAAGGGLGHLKRVQRFMAQTQTHVYRVISNNPAAIDLFGRDAVLPLLGDSAAEWRAQIRHFIHVCTPQEFCIDTFPNGILGELDATLVAASVTYLARRLKWNAYYQLLAPPRNQFRFSTAYVFEPLEAEHQAFIDQHAAQRIGFQLSRADLEAPADSAALAGKRLWLVMHSSHAEEVEALVDDALDLASQDKCPPAVLVLSDVPIQRPGVEHILAGQLAYVLPRAEKVFCGGGFNTLFELQPYRTKVRAVPFPRKFDDQAWRIRTFFAAP